MNRLTIDTAFGRTLRRLLLVAVLLVVVPVLARLAGGSTVPVAPAPSSSPVLVRLVPAPAAPVAQTVRPVRP